MGAHHALNVKGDGFRGRIHVFGFLRGMFRFRRRGSGRCAAPETFRPVMRGIPYIQQVQTERVQTDGNAGKTHGGSAVHGAHFHGEQTRGERDADQIVKERPEQILMDIPDRSAAQPDRGGHVGKIAVHQNDLRAVDRDVRSGSDRDPDIRSGQCRRRPSQPFRRSGASG